MINEKKNKKDFDTIIKNEKKKTKNNGLNMILLNRLANQLGMKLLKL